MARYERLALYCSLTRVGPLDDKDETGADLLGFAVTLSAGYLESTVLTDPELTPKEVAALAPWEWTVKNDAWTAWGKEIASGDWKSLASPLFRPAGGDAPAQGGNALTAAIGKRIQGLAFPESFLAQPAFNEDDAGTERIHSLFASLATRPAPIPHQLGLTFLLRIPALDVAGYSELVVAPTMGPGALGEQVPIQMPPQPEAEAYRIDYAVAMGSIPVRAFQYPAPVALPSSDDLFVDLATGWVKQGPNGASGPTWAATDWTEALEPRLANAFDFAWRLTHLLREDFAENFPQPLTSPVLLAEYRKAVLGLSRDLAGMGLTRPPAGRSLLDEVLAAVGPGDRTAVENAARLYDSRVDLDAWRELLKAQIPSLAGLLAIENPGTPRPSEQRADEISDLDRLCSAVADETNLRRLILAQWEKAMAEVDPGPRLAVRRFLEGHLAEIDVRLALARASIEPHWNELIGLDRTPQPWTDLAGTSHFEARNPDERAEFKRRLGDRMIHALSGRLAALGIVGLSAVNDDVRKGLRGFADRTADEILPAVPKGPPEEGDGSPTPMPHPVTFQVDRVGGLSDDPATDLKDLQYSLAGFGLLMMATGENEPWRCLHLAEVRAQDGSLIDARTVVPSNLGYRNGLRETGLTYNNHPLAAETPAQGLAGERALEVVGGDEPTPLFSYLAVKLPEVTVEEWDHLPTPRPGVTDDEWARLPALRFGRSYQALPFAVLNGGTLPKEARQSGDPTRLASFNGFSVPEAVVRTYGRAFRYLRRVRVGLPRLQRNHEALPTIPPTVHPLARELSPGTPDESVPLLLLVPQRWKVGRTQFTFELRKPATDLLTWDRWVAGDLTLSDRANLWAEFHRDPSSERDATFDDPAVAPFFFARIAPKFQAGAHPAGEKSAWIDIPADPQAGAFALARTGPVQVVCSIGDPQCAVENGKLIVKVPEGDVWELTVHPAVESRLYTDEKDRRFHPQAGLGLSEISGPDGKRYLLEPPHRLLIEVANEPPERQEFPLWKALRPEVHGSRIAVHLHDGGTLFPWASRVELRRQVWRWNGRTVRPFPDLNPGSPDAAGSIPESILRWEATAFSDRDDADCARLAARISRLDRDPLLWEHDVEGDRRALLYRFGLTAWSRYEGLIPTAREKVMATISLDGGTKSISHPWRRLVVPCRWVDAVPLPKIKLAVPLTEASGSSAAGLLVVLNEPWYEVGGLAETLSTEVLTVKDPKGQSRPELGPDPILTGAGWDPKQSVSIEAEAPFGHTFDTDAKNPLFLATSFVLPAPKAASGDLSWHFARIRFQRTLRIDGTYRKSVPTSPLWVQFLPSSSAYDFATKNGAVPFDALALEIDPGVRLVARGAHDGVKVGSKVKPAQESRVRFVQVLLLTRRIRDVSGRPGESYAGLYQPAGETWTPIDAPPQLPKSPEGYLARLVEVQERIPEVETGGTTDFWSRLFPPGPSTEGGFGDDAQARIVRVSSPIPMDGPAE